MAPTTSGDPALGWTVEDPRGAAAPVLAGAVDSGDTDRAVAHRLGVHLLAARLVSVFSKAPRSLPFLRVHQQM